MKKLLLLLCLLPAMAIHSQNTDAVRIEERRRQRDSVMDYYQRKRDSLQQQLYLSDTAQIRKNVQASVDYFVRLQKENRRKQKRVAIIRIAIGIGLLAFLVAVLMKRKKK